MSDATTVPPAVASPETTAWEPITHWRILKAAVAGYQIGDVVPAAELAPHVGAMHGRGLIEPATADEAHILQPGDGQPLQEGTLAPALPTAAATHAQIAAAVAPRQAGEHPTTRLNAAALPDGAV